MVRNTNSGSNNWGLKEEESIELDLGLSVGGSYSKQNATVLNPSLEENKDQKTKREIHLLRRQEAKKKQQLKRELTKNDGVLLKANCFEPEWKKMKREENGSDLNFTADGKIGTCYAAAAAPCISSPVPGEVGFVYPCGNVNVNVNVVPCWVAGGGAAAAEVKIQPVVGYGFVPLGLDHSLGNGYGSEENCSGDKGNRKSGSNGSTSCTSSSGSDHRSPSNEGGGSNSSYTRSHSSPPMQQKPKLNETKSRSDLTISNISESALSLDEATYTNAENLVPMSKSQPISENKKFRRESKPPKPPSKDQTNPPLPYLPCVSTTGNGPNGKTVNGFLYRYTKNDVSIVCVCHGSSFSPAEFVQHAGGTDILHPLRHITVVRSAF